jgi:hypothetical protein
VYIGWRRDSKCELFPNPHTLEEFFLICMIAYRELVRFASGYISSISVVPDFGQLLIVNAGSLLTFDLNGMIPTSEPVTWVPKVRRDGVMLNSEESAVAFVRVGTTKGRLLGEGSKQDIC